jgi:hypothetical protein
MLRPPGIGAFQFVILASLRAVQLTRGCRPRIDGDGDHKNTVIAQLEVSQGKVSQALALTGVAVEPTPVAPLVVAT